MPESVEALTSGVMAQVAQLSIHHGGDINITVLSLSIASRQDSLCRVSDNISGSQSEYTLNMNETRKR